MDDEKRLKLSTKQDEVFRNWFGLDKHSIRDTEKS